LKTGECFISLSLTGECLEKLAHTPDFEYDVTMYLFCFSVLWQRCSNWSQKVLGPAWHINTPSVSSRLLGYSSFTTLCRHSGQSNGPLCNSLFMQLVSRFALCRVILSFCLRHYRKEVLGVSVTFFPPTHGSSKHKSQQIEHTVSRLEMGKLHMVTPSEAPASALGFEPETF
jgi:hypothetical protein